MDYEWMCILRAYAWHCLDAVLCPERGITDVYKHVHPRPLHSRRESLHAITSEGFMGLLAFQPCASETRCFSILLVPDASHLFGALGALAN